MSKNFYDAIKKEEVYIQLARNRQYQMKGFKQ